MIAVTRRHLLSAGLVIVALLFWSGTGALAWFSYDVTMRLPGREALSGIGDMAQATTILDAKDRQVFTIFKEQRIEIPLERMSPNLLKAVISVEDQRYYEHNGVDIIRVAAAALANLKEGRRAEGGSTITQQLARQSFLTRDKTIRRKLKEVVLAARLEQTYSKSRILELYLNKVYFGDGLYGAEAASRGFFGKSAKELDIAEAALLAGVIQSPSTYAPTINLDRAIARRNVVLQTMVQSGAITREEYETARATKVELKNGLQLDERFGLYYEEAVRQALVKRFGWERVYRGGLCVYTALDSELQQAAERVFEEGLAEIEGHPRFDHATRAQVVKAASGGPSEMGYLQGALFAMDPRTGHVPVMIGGRDFSRSRFNRAMQARRQPGSAFKPFVFAAALESGYSPASIITNLDDPILTQEGEWVPEDEHSAARSMTLRSALRMSSNRAAVQLLRQVGIPRAVSYAEKLAIGTPPSVPSLALGAGVVTLDAMTSAFGAFANQGLVREPVLIRRVEDSEGNVLFKDEREPSRAVTESTAFLMANMLADVVNAGTGYRARREGFILPAAGKTGTTNDYVDAWFVGFTPSLVTGVWIGFDQPRTILREGYAGDLAVPLWARFMKVATRGAKAEWIDRPANVVGVNICRVSGKLPNEGCSSVAVEASDGTVRTQSLVYTDYFVRGSQPGDVCPLHPAPSFLQRLAGAFGMGGSDAQPVVAEEVGLPLGSMQPPPPVATTGASRAEPATKKAEESRAEEKSSDGKKKRGFWSRLFGRGGDDDEKKKKEEEAKRKKEERRKPGG
jgi:penicillin-binding protein 1A